MARLAEYEFEKDNEPTHATSFGTKIGAGARMIHEDTPSETSLVLMTMAADGYTAERIANQLECRIEDVVDAIDYWEDEIDALRKALFIDRVTDYDRLLAKCLWRVELKLENTDRDIALGDLARIINTLSERRDKLLGHRDEERDVNINADKVLVLADAADSFNRRYKIRQKVALGEYDEDDDADSDT